MKINLKNNILIFSLGINSYGGKNILKFVLEKYKENNLFLISDTRLNLKTNNVKKMYLDNNFFSYCYFYFFYNKKKYDHIFFVNGLPPLFKLNTNHFVFFQNANILNFNNNLKWIFSKNLIRYIYFNTFKANTSNWVVFNNFTKKILSKRINQTDKINVINYFFHSSIDQKKKTTKTYDLFYPASGDPHKNHTILFKSLILLAKKNIYPKLLITLNDNHYKKLDVLSLIKKYNLKITNHYFDNEIDIYNAYLKSKALIFPSLNETLGIPLYEADYFNIKITMSNKLKLFKSNKNISYFNPYSEKSVSDAIINII